MAACEAAGLTFTEDKYGSFVPDSWMGSMQLLGRLAKLVIKKDEGDCVGEYLQALDVYGTGVWRKSKNGFSEAEIKQLKLLAK